MKQTLLLTFSILYFSFVHSQNVGIGTIAPKASAALDVTATDKGMLTPRMTTIQRKSIMSPERGLLVFDTDFVSFMFYDGQEWKALDFKDENNVTPQFKTSKDVSYLGYLGTSVSISGNYAIAGQPRYYNVANGSVANPIGLAIIFHKSANGWVQQARLSPADSSNGSYFGSAVAISGDYAAASAPDRAGIGRGKIYIYKRSGATWIQEANFLGYDFRYGASVSITISSNGTPLLAVGSPLASSGTGAGIVFTYSRNNSTAIWSNLQVISPNDLPSLGDQFGHSVHLDGDFMAIGAPNNNPGGAIGAGAVYIYVYAAGSYLFQQKINGTLADAKFGYSVCLDGNNLAIGAPFKSNFTSTTPFAYLFTRMAATWTQRFRFYAIESDYGNNGQYFGLSVSLKNNWLLIGNPGGYSSLGGNRTISGKQSFAYLYRINTLNPDPNNYYPDQKFEAPFPQFEDLFGNSVSLDASGNFIIGIPGAKSNNTVNAGGLLFGKVGD